MVFKRPLTLKLKSKKIARNRYFTLYKEYCHFFYFCLRFFFIVRKWGKNNRKLKKRIIFQLLAMQNGILLNPEHQYLADSSPRDLLFSDDEASNFKLHEKTIELVGIARDLVETGQLFKFTLSNVELTAVWAKTKNQLSITAYPLDLTVTSLTLINVLGVNDVVAVPQVRPQVQRFQRLAEAMGSTEEIGKLRISCFKILFQIKESIKLQNLQLQTF